MSQLDLDYSAADVPIREDLKRTHRELVAYLGRPGCWFSGAERVAIAAESRNAFECPLCIERKQALSPDPIVGSHERVSELPEAVVEVAHRVRGDSQRLSRGWFERTLASGLGDAEYVEVVGIVTLVAGVDYFCRALGIRPFPLPTPEAGEPSRLRPENTTSGIAWVPMLLPEDASGPEADLYVDAPMIPNIARALSLVPDHVRMLQNETASHYVDLADLSNPSVGRDLDRKQIELVAARVSALNECFY
jgi:alkylhydroperoxidase family enzyme